MECLINISLILSIVVVAWCSVQALWWIWRRIMSFTFVCYLCRQNDNKPNQIYTGFIHCKLSHTLTLPPNQNPGVRVLPQHYIHFSSRLCIEPLAFFHRVTERDIHRELHHRHWSLCAIADWMLDNRSPNRQNRMAFLVHDGAEINVFER